MNPKVTVLTSLYNCKNYLNNFFDHVAKIERSENIEILLLHNAPTKEEIEIINPYIIVCGGKRGTLNNLSIKHEKIINDYHPASSRHNSDINDQLRMLELQ